ncbi:MAG: AAA family ATPase [Planctomycetes bacterium]|nr:AAA family ATPase [Planctomycetota bacterium]
MEIRAWLEERSLGRYAERFEANGVEVTDLPGLQVSELADELGLIDLGDRLRLLEAVGAAPAPLTEAPGTWLTRLGLEDHLETFARLALTPATLVLLTASDLQDRLGVTRLADRRRALAALERLRQASRDPLAGVLSGALSLEALPFPIAHPLAFALEPGGSPSDRLDNLIFASLQSVRLTALLLLADYLAVPLGAPEVDAYVYRALRQPSWADWADLCDRLARFWRGRSEPRGSRFPGLVAGWGVVGAKRGGIPQGWEALLEGLPGLGEQPARSANEALWRARNDLAHRRATRSASSEEDAARLGRLAPVLVEALALLFGAESPTLLRRVEGGGAVVLRGPHLDLAFAIEEAPGDCEEAFAISEVVARSAEGVLAVYPLVAPLEVEPSEGVRSADGLTGHMDLGLIDGVTERSAVLMGVQRFEELPELGVVLREALARKGVVLRVGERRLDPFVIAELAASAARDQLSVLRGRKYFPESYVERRRLERAVREQLERPGEALLLLGEAGTGKSSLLARLIEEQVGGEEGSDERPALPAAHKEGPQLVVYLQGRTAFPTDSRAPAARLLCEAVCRQAGIQRSRLESLEDLLESLEARGLDAASGGRMLLVIDALNEADRFRELAEALDEALRCLGRFPWLRLIVSIRTGAYHALEQSHAELKRHGLDPFANGRFWRRFEAGKDQDPQGFLEVRPFRGREIEEAYLARQRATPGRSCSAAYADLPAEIRTLLATPLQLHLFHETYRGRVVPSSLNAGRLLRDHLDRIVSEQPGLAATLAELGREMLDRRRADVPEEVADALVAEWRASLGSMRERAIRLDPLEELQAASILVRPRPEGEGAACYTFCHERLAEQVLLAEVRRRSEREGGLSSSTLLRWTREAIGEGGDPFPLLLDALGELWADLARAGDGKALRDLASVESSSARAELLSTALCALAPLWGESEEGAAGPRAVLDSLFAQPSVEAAFRLREGTWRAQQRVSRTGARAYGLALARRRVVLLRAACGGASAPPELRRELAVSLSSCAFLVSSGGDGEQGRALLEEACGLLSELEGGSEEVRGELAYVRSQLARSVERHQGPTAALSYAAEACRLRRELWKEAPESLHARQVYAFVLNLRGSLLAQVEESEGSASEGEALATYAQAAELLRDADRSALGNASRVFAFTLSKLARLARQAGELEAARRYADEGVAEVERQARVQPTNIHLQRSLGFAREEVAEIAHAERDLETAHDLLEGVLEIRRRLVDRDPRNVDFRRDLGFALLRLGKLEAELGRSQAARDVVLLAVSVREALARDEPERRDLARDVAQALQAQAGLCEPIDEARPHLLAARAALAPLLGQGDQDAASLDQELREALGAIDLRS